MAEGRFFNSLGYGSGNRNPQQNNSNNNQRNNMNNRPPQGVNVDVMNVGPMNQGMQQSPMMNGNSMNQGMQQNPMMNGNSMNQGMQQNPMMNSNSMNQGMQQNPMMSNPMNQGMQQNSMMNGNSMNQGMQQNSMMNSNPMNQGMQQNPMMNSNPMNQGPQQNSIMSNNMMMNPNIGANQSFGALRQDPTPSGNNPMQPMMNNPQTGARQDFLGGNQMNNNSQQNMMNNSGSMNQGIQQNSMMNGNPMNQGPQQNPMMNSNPMNQGMQQNPMMNRNPMNQGPQRNPMMNGNPMNQGMQQNPMNNGMMMNPNMGANQSFGALRQDPTPSGNNPIQPMMNNQQTGARQDFLGVNAMTNTPVDLDGPTQLTPGKPVIMPEVPSSPSKPDISIKPKYNNNIKIIIIGGLLAIAVICLVLVLICYKTVTCTSEDKLESQGVTVYTTVKSYFWLGEIDKIVTEMVVDISALGPDRKSEVIDYYSDLEESDTKVKVNGDEIILIKTIRPESDDETDISPDEFKDAYTDLGLTCK